MENNNWKFKVSRKYHNSGKFLHSESQICMLLHKYHISERKEKQIWRTRFENWNKYVPQFWAISAFRFANTVFPHIVSAETILFWLWAYVLWPLIIVHKCAETIHGRKLFKDGNYMRKYGILIVRQWVADLNFQTFLYRITLKMQFQLKKKSRKIRFKFCWNYYDFIIFLQLRNR